MVDLDKVSSFGNTLFASPMSEKDHILVNGYSNAWRIDRSGSYAVINTVLSSILCLCWSQPFHLSQFLQVWFS